MEASSHQLPSRSVVNATMLIARIENGGTAVIIRAISPSLAAFSIADLPFFRLLAIRPESLRRSESNFRSLVIDECPIRHLSL